MQPAKTLVTLWFVNAAQPRAVVEAEPDADRGFARKYLAQYNPSWPLTHIGDFDMARSAPPGSGEFYIGGYPGLSVVQTVFTDLEKISEIPERYRTLVGASDIYAIAVSADKARQVEATGEGAFGAFAHWSGGTLKRAFTASRQTVFEDVGLPYSFEMLFWAGNTPATGIELPFIPAEMAHAAETEWLGFSVAESGLELPICAFAVDGRPEAKVETTPRRKPLPQADKVSVFSDEQGYDDYSDSSTTSPTKQPSNKQLARDVAGSIGHAFGRGAQRLSSIAGKIGDEVRRRARNADRK